MCLKKRKVGKMLVKIAAIKRNKAYYCFFGQRLEKACSLHLNEACTANPGMPIILLWFLEARYVSKRLCQMGT